MSTSVGVESSAIDNNESRRPRRGSRLSRIAGVRKFFIFLSIPGVIRLLELFLSAIHVGSYGYYCTYYEKVLDLAVPPFFLATTRETFFMLTNFHSLLSTFTILIASTISVRSHTALLGSLYMFVFDFIQFLLLLAASVGLLFLYQEENVTRNVDVSVLYCFAVSGMVLAVLHLIGSIYDLGIYIRKTEPKEPIVQR